MKRILPELKAHESQGQSVRRRERAAQDRGRALGDAGAGRRDRIRRLHRRRHGAAGGVQGAARTTSRRRRSKPKTPAKVAIADAEAEAQGEGRARPARRRSREATRASEAGRAEVMGVVISKPDKELWPASGDQRRRHQARSGEVFRGGRRLADRHIKGRPCSIVRAPDGINGEHFFQRHAMPGMSNLIDLVEASRATANPICRSTASRG